jgi:hypothetical protein
MTPFYAHLEGIPGFGVASNVDRVGVLAAAGVGAAFAAHGVIEIGRHLLSRREKRAAPTAPVSPPSPDKEER